MSQSDKSVWIPRNLNEEDSIKFLFGMRVRPMSDIPVAALTVFAIMPFTSGLEDFYKYIVYFCSVIFGCLLSRIKYNGQGIPELCLNSLTYSLRKRRYNIKRRKL